MRTLFSDLERFGDRTALLSLEQILTYGEMLSRADALCAPLKLHQARRPLIIILCSNSVECVTGYVGALRAGAVPMLLHSSIKPAQLASIAACYRPNVFYAPSGAVSGARQIAELGRYALSVQEQVTPPDLHPDLSLLLTTSGTTGSRSLVRLSSRNLISNANGIGDYLGISAQDRPITTLPMNYTYGMSILNSHVIRGASIITTEYPVVRREFWSELHDKQATTFGGVPFTYQMLKKLRFAEMNLPTVRYFTQAGGRLPPELIREFNEIAKRKGQKFFVMYGQTEATSRISYVPWEYAESKAGSIGIPIPHGHMRVIDDNGGNVVKAGDVGEIEFSGDGVSLGYAQNHADLKLGDEFQGRLRTGDLGYQDSDGFFYITGRKKRSFKIFGHRVNLDEVEEIVRSAGYDCACTAREDYLQVYIAQEHMTTKVRDLIISETGLNPRGFEVRTITHIPRSESGKIDYASLAAGS